MSLLRSNRKRLFLNSLFLLVINSWIPALNATTPLQIPKKHTITIAIVDDGVRTTHKHIAPYLWHNVAEDHENGMDDDGNGHINDINGWDVADNNADINPPQTTAYPYYHGTHLASIITQTLKNIYGEQSTQSIRIMPIKAIADEAAKPYIKHGFQGINYAIQAGADIIVTAWGQNQLSEAEAKILKTASNKGILIIASAGNFGINTPQFPAAYPNVVSVASVNLEGKKSPFSNFGESVDISAMGEDVRAASFRSDSAEETHSGTSQATALVAAAFAALKLQHPSYSWNKLKACIKNSATPLENTNANHIAQLGAGALNLTAALECDTTALTKSTPQGYLDLTNKQLTTEWNITPVGRFLGLHFNKKSLTGNLAQAELLAYKGIAEAKKPYINYKLSELPESFYLPSTTAKIQLNVNKGAKISGLLEYRAKPIDFAKEYCSGTQYLTQPGSFSDGSGTSNYAFNTDCKWQITAPEGKVIRFDFTQLNTEPNVDKIYFFNGDKTNGHIMASFSGNKLPPVLVTWTNKVLVWFVTDGKNQGKGWKANYYFE